MAAYGVSYGDNAQGIVAGMSIPLIPLMIAAPVIRVRLAAGRRPGHDRMLIGLIVAVVFIRIGVAIVSYNAGFGPAIWPAMVPYALAPLAALGFRWLQAPSREGRRVMDQIDGFKQYLSVAEEDRLEFLNPPKKTPELFETLSALCHRAATSRTAGPTASPACWRPRASAPRCRPGTTARNSAPTRASSFTERVSDNLSRTISSASTPPGSSGGSDGGGPVAARAAAARRAAAEAGAAGPAGDRHPPQQRSRATGSA